MVFLSKSHPFLFGVSYDLLSVILKGNLDGDVETK